VTQPNVLGYDDGDCQWESEGRLVEAATDPKTDRKTRSYVTVANSDEGRDAPHPRQIRPDWRYGVEEGR